MKTIFVLLLMLGSAAATLAQTAVVTLQAPLGAAAPGSEVRVNLVVLNPGSTAIAFPTPATSRGTLSNERRTWPVELRAASPTNTSVAPNGFASQTFAFTLPADVQGRLVLDVAQPQPARTVIEVATARDTTPAAAAANRDTPAETPQTAESIIKRSFAGRFSSHEPMYFLYGTKAPAAKFQFSIAYRLLGEAGKRRGDNPAAHGLHVGYTQRSLWDIAADSSPFYDTSYMPEILYESQSVLSSPTAGGFQFLGYQTGFRHESNGQGGLSSRSMNIAYVRPFFSVGRLDRWHVLVSPRVFAYVGDLRDNRDIQDYRGNAELSASISRNDSFGLTLTGRLGQGAHKGSLQADLTFPIQSEMLLNFASYFQIQYWTGYGESLRAYDKKTETVRAGFSLVR